MGSVEGVLICIYSKKCIDFTGCFKIMGSASGINFMCNFKLGNVILVLVRENVDFSGNSENLIVILGNFKGMKVVKSQENQGSTELFTELILTKLSRCMSGIDRGFWGICVLI